LEYRGYDSSGLVILDPEQSRGGGIMQRVRAVGKIDNLVAKLKDAKYPGTLGIAHTRWATHGGVTEENAHPHIAQDGGIAIVHNGIIENYRELKEKLKKDGVKFTSDTDSEVLAHLIAHYYSTPPSIPPPQGEGKAGIRSHSSPLPGSPKSVTAFGVGLRGEDKGGGENQLANAVKSALKEVRGTYGLLVVHADHPDQIIAARLGSPLVIGVAAGEHYIASDVTPMLAYTKQVTFLDDGEVAEISRDNLRISNLKDELITKPTTQIDWDQAKAQKGGYEHFMLKEIMEQPTVFEDAIRGRINMEEGTAVLGGLNISEDQMRDLKRIVIISGGTAYYAGLVGKYAFERLAQIPCEVDFSSEFRYRDPICDKKTLVYAVSQSGETADTIMAVREAKRKGAHVRGIINVVGSTIAREIGAGSYIHAGPEMAVASTKAYTNMVALLLLNAIQLGRLKHVTQATGKRMLESLLAVPAKMNEILAQAEEIKKIAKKYTHYKNLFFLGRGVNYPVALEGSLKLKEISYIHSEGYAGGEMKHGPLALVSDDFPVVAILTRNQLYEKMKSNIMEARARGAKTLIIATEGDQEASEVADDIIFVPKTMELLEPLLNTIPLQLLAYYIAVELGRDVDRPRNLAKSVTVE